MTKPNVYVLGGVQEIDIITKDRNNTVFIPSEARLSIKEPGPAGVIVTVSGDQLQTASGYQFYLYRPPTIGWYEYEVWVKDGSGREDTETNGFEVIDRVY